MYKEYNEIDIMAECEGRAISIMNKNRCRILNRYKQHKPRPTNYPRLKAKGIKMAKDETSAEKFTRLANSRVNNALQKIGLIGNLSSSQYSYTDEQVQKIEQALYQAVETTMANFNKAKIAKPTFTL